MNGWFKLQPSEAMQAVSRKVPSWGEAPDVIARWNMNGLNSLNEQYCTVIFSY